jgi:hypothetical protein
MKYVVWTLLFDNSLDRLRETIPTFDFSNFASKDIIIPKAQHVWRVRHFGKIIQDIWKLILT